MAITIDPEREQAARQRIAALIKEARQQAGWSQSQLQRKLAEAMGVEGLALNTISRYETGYASPPLGTLDALCEVLTGRQNALAEGLAVAFEREEAPPARKRKESP